MRYDIGTVLNISALNQPVAGSEISEQVYEGVTVYSLAKNTDIPVRSFPNLNGLFFIQGTIEMYTKDLKGIKDTWTMHAGDALILPAEVPFGGRASEDTVLVGVELGKKLNESIVNPGEVIHISALAPYQEGNAWIDNIFSSGFMNFTVMSLDANTQCDNIRACGGLIITAVEGESTVHYEDADFLLHVGESFRVRKNDTFDIKAGNNRSKVSIMMRMD